MEKKWLGEKNNVAVMTIGIITLLCIVANVDSAFASSTAGGGLPFDSWFTNIRTSVTGPFAFTASIVGIVGAGATLIFGGDMNGFLRTIIFIVLVLSFLVAAQNTLTGITGTGAEICTISNSLADRLYIRIS